MKRKIKMAINPIENLINLPSYHYPHGCNAVWGGLSILKGGDVYPCCMHPHGLILGNININSPEEILNGSVAKYIRGKSRKGIMPCKSCKAKGWLRVPIDKDVHSSNIVSRGVVSKLQVQVSTFCNYRCYMCGQDHSDRSVLDYNLLWDFFEYVNPKSIYFIGGETFYAQDIDQLLAKAYKTFSGRLKLCTNGALPLNRIEEVLDHYVHVSVSNYGTTDDVYQAVTGRSRKQMLTYTRTLAKNRADKVPHLKMLLTVVPSNFHQIPDVVVLAEELGFDSVDYGWDSASVVQFIKQYPVLANRVWNRLEKVVSQSKIPVGVSPWVSYGYGTQENDKGFPAEFFPEKTQ